MALPKFQDRNFFKACSAPGRRIMKHSRARRQRHQSSQLVRYAARDIAEEFPRRDLEIDTPVPVRRPRMTLQRYIQLRGLLGVN